MNNSNALVFFKNMNKTMREDNKCVKLACNTDCTDIDAEFILKYVDNNSEVLDLGSGSGLIVNRIYNKIY